MRAADQVSRLMDLLDQQVGQVERLVAVAQELQGALLRADVAAIERALAEGQRLADHGRQLEERRYRLQEDLARSWGVETASLTWRQLAHREPALTARLGEQRRRLWDAVRRLERLQRENTALARQGLAWTRFGLEALGVAGEAPVYGPDGQRSLGHTGRTVDRVL